MGDNRLSPFVRNQWYAASWGRDLGREPLARTICGEPIVLYRRRDGQAVAMRDACGHRLLPLSMGMVEDDDLRCKYHGLKVDSEGRCIEMPLKSERCSPALAVPTYPIVERYGFVWVWIGDPALAEPALLPDFWPCETPGWAVYGGFFHVECNYQLVIDNLMDLTHETYVHPETIGQQELLETPIEAASHNGRVTVSRWMAAVEAPPAWAALHGKPGLVDRWQVCNFFPPCSVLIDTGVASVEDGATLENHDRGTRSFVINAVTPETERTCTYFWGGSRNFGVDDEALSARLETMAKGVFQQDIDILEAQQRSLEIHRELKLQSLSIDAGGTRSRLLNARLAAAADS